MKYRHTVAHTVLWLLTTENNFIISSSYWHESKIGSIYRNLMLMEIKFRKKIEWKKKGAQDYGSLVVSLFPISRVLILSALLVNTHETVVTHNNLEQRMLCDIARK